MLYPQDRIVARTDRMARLGVRWLSRPTRLVLIILTIIVSLVLLGPEIVISKSSRPALFNRIVPWRPYCRPSAGSTALHYSYKNPISRALWTYQPITGLGPDDHAWPYATRSIPHFAPDVKPVGVFIGLLCTAGEAKRRQMIRRTYRRWIKDEMITFKFFIGRHSGDSLEAEMHRYNDIIVLDVMESMNRGKTFAFFDWAAKHARVQACDGSTTCHETQPDYIIKADMDTFLVLPAIERRLRMLPRNNVYWGRLVMGNPGLYRGNNGGLFATGDYMAGAGYGLSMDLVRYISESDYARNHRRGSEDQRVGDWIRSYPEVEKVVWVTEECWMYDHPKASMSWSHGFIFPAVINAIEQDQAANLTPAWLPAAGIERWSTTTPSRKVYAPISKSLTQEQVAESLIEGSSLSLLHPHNLQQSLIPEELDRRIATAFDERRSRSELMEGWAKGSTLWVHSVKQDEWWYDAEMVLQDR